MSTKTDLPFGLVNEVKRGNCVPFIGAGLSIPSGGPSWSRLVKELLADLSDFNLDGQLSPFADHLKASPLKDTLLQQLEGIFVGQLNPLMVAQLYEQQHGRHQLITLVKEFIDKIGEPGLIYESLVKLNAADYITTNYDNLITEALRMVGVDYTTIIDDHQVAYATSQQSRVLKMHGSLKDPFAPDSIIFTRNDFEAYDLKHPGINTYIQFLLTTKTILMLGYSINDPNFVMMHDRVRHHLKHHAKAIYFVTFDMPTHVCDYWTSGGFHPINLDGADKTASLNDWLARLVSRVV